MKKTFLPLALIGALLTAPALATAEKGENAQGTNTEVRMQYMQRMQQQLELTDEQSDAMAQVFTTQREKMQAVRSETEAAITDILTPEQQTTWQNMKKERAQKWQRHTNKHHMKEQRGKRGEGMMENRQGGMMNKQDGEKRMERQRQHRDDMPMRPSTAN